MNKHKHVTTCDHEIKACDCCDSAYCIKCEKEWGAEKPCNLNHYPTYLPYPQPVYVGYPSRQPFWWSTNATGGINQFGSMLQLSSTGSNQQ